MGCSASNIREDYLNQFSSRRRKPFEEERFKYNTNHENFETIMLDTEIRNYFFQNSENTNFISFFELFYGIYKYRFDKYNMSYNDVKVVILEKLVESQLKESFLFKEYNMTQHLKNIIEEQSELNEDQCEMGKNFILTSTRYFPSKQRGCTVALKDFENIEKWGFKHYLTNLKYNACYSLEIINIVITPFLLKQDEALIDLCEIIEVSSKLTTLTITVANLSDIDSEDKYNQNFSLDSQQVKMISCLFKAVRNNENVKFLFLANYSNYMYNWTEEINLAFIELLKLDRLLSLGISKINFSSEVSKNVFGAIENLRNLKFILLDVCQESNSFNTDKLSLIKSTLIRNKRLLGAFFTLGEEHVVNKENIKNEILSANTYLKYLECSRQFKFFNF